MNLRRIPKPQSDAELEIVSNAYFGKPLHLAKLNRGRYEVKERFDSYDPFHGDYDEHHRFWDWVCGPLYCGGTAGVSYGQFRCGYRHRRRLDRWISSRRKGDSSSVRPAFRKVSRALMGSERTSRTMDRGVL